MKAELYESVNSFTVADVRTPVSGPGQVLIEVLSVGVCGADVHIHHGGSGMASSGPAMAALRAGRGRAGGIITHHFGLDHYQDALNTVTTDPTAHKVVVDVADRP